MPDLPPFRLAQFVRGMSRPFQGAAFLLSRRGLKRYAALPLVLNLVLYLVALSVFFYFIANWQVGGVEWNFWGPVGSWLAAAVNWMSWTVKLVAVVAALAFSFFTFTAVGMVVASPLNDLLSEKVENAYAAPDEKVDLPLRFTSKAAVLSVYDSVGTLIRQLVCTILALPFLLVPLVGFVPLALVGSYFAGYGFLDAAMARNFLRGKHKKLITNRHFWEILGFGLVMQFAFAIPFLGILLMPVGVTAGTMLYCSENWDALLADAGMQRPEGFVPPGAPNKPASTPPAVKA